MKIYTEVNYEFKDGSLVEQSSKFYNYDGQVAECKSSGEDIKKDVQEEVVTAVTKPWESKIGTGQVGGKSLEIMKQIGEDTGISDAIREGPGGTSKEVVDAIYGGDTKNAVQSIQRTYRDAEGSVANILNPFGRVSTDITSENVEEEEQTTDTTLEEQESILTQGLIAEGGRKEKFGRKAMSTGTKASSILNPLQ